MVHNEILNHIVRRGLEAATAVTTTATSPDDAVIQPHDPDMRPPWDAIKDQLPGWAPIPLFLTIFIFVLGLMSIRYTLMGVVATLAQVETPTAEYVSLNPPVGVPKLDDEMLDEDPAPAYSDTDALNAPSAASRDPETLLVAHKPITASIRGTIRHIHSIGGFGARWRGLSVAVCTALVNSLVFQLLSALFILVMPAALASTLSGVTSTVILARWYLAWTHIVISEPSHLRWFRRVPTFRMWRNIWAPTAINALAAQVARLAPMGLLVALGMTDQDKVLRMAPVNLIWKIFLIVFVYLIVWIAVVLPSEVALTRCQASMLPDSDESIVPFDRSFGGKVTPAIVGGTGMLSFIDAWKSFDRKAMSRLVKLYAKIFAIDVSLHLLFTIVLTVELVALLGKKAPEAIAGGFS